jgi:cytochrome P450
LAENPGIQEKLYDEIKDFSFQDQENLLKNLKNTKYLDNCLQETLRMHPSFVETYRTVRQDTTILGHNISRGTKLVLSIRHMQRDESIYKRANDFLPERWDDKSTPAVKTFGGGVRMCAGSKLATVNNQNNLGKYQICNDHFDAKVPIHHCRGRKCSNCH